MPTVEESVEIAVEDRLIEGTLIAPRRRLPGVLFVHGWGGSQEQYVARAHEVSALGCVCLTFDLGGHARDASRRGLVTREDNLRDVIAAYDRLLAHRAVDRDDITVVGSSYGGYLAAILTAERPVRRLVLRVPALYKDDDWMTPKGLLDREALDAYRRGAVAPDDSRALRACSRFRGDVLVVESEHDRTVPHPVIENYMAAFVKATSLTYRLMGEADHGLSEVRWQRAYTGLLVKWITEMLAHAREQGQDGTPLAAPPPSRRPAGPADERISRAAPAPSAARAPSRSTTPSGAPGRG